MKKFFLDHKLKPHRILKYINGKAVIKRNAIEMFISTTGIVNKRHVVIYGYAEDSYKKIMTLMGHDVSEIQVNLTILIKKYLNKKFDTCKTIIKKRIILPVIQIIFPSFIQNTFKNVHISLTTQYFSSNLV